MTSKRTRNASTDEDEIEILDDVKVKNRRRRPTKKKKETKIDENRDDLLADIDLDGVPEEEKEQLKMAILASRTEDYNRNKPDVFTNREGTDVSREDDTVIKEPTDGHSHDEISDDDILADSAKRHGSPASMLANDSVSTQVDSPNAAANAEYFKPTQKGGPNPIEQDNSSLSKDLYNKETDDEEVYLDFSKSTLNDDAIGDDEDEDETQRPDSPVAVDDQNDCVLEDFGTDKQSSQSQHGQSHSQNSSNNEGQRSTPLSRDTKGKSDQKPESLDSQGSEGFLPTMPDSESQTSQKSGTSDDSLERHYRAVKNKVPESDLYYCPVGMDVKKCATAISQLFDVYSRELRRAQQQLFRNTGKLKWPDSVKTGQHHEKSIDAKRRGHDVHFFEMTDLDDKDDFQPVVLKKDKVVGVCKMSDSDNDLPDLIVEEPVQRPTAGVRKIRYTAAEAAQMIAEGGTMRAGEPRGPEMVDVGGNVKASSHRRNGKRLGRSCKTKEHIVFVEDTQSYEYADNFFVTDKNSKMGPVIEETQISDDDDWLNVNKTARFENKGQKDKLKRYTTPRRNDKNTDSKLHQTNIDNNDNEKQNTGSNSKKRKTPGKVIVEDTQEIEEKPKSNKKPHKKLKRDCFKIESEDSEEESIPETQIDFSQPNIVEEDNISGEIHRKILTEATNTNVINPELLEDPLITLKGHRKLFTEKLNKFDQRPVHKTDVKLKEEDNCPPVDIMLSSTHKSKQNKKAGRNLKLGRHTSKDSIHSTNSDNVSVTSQVSNTLLDDNGDLYSTQVGEMRNNKQTNKKRKTIDQPTDMEPESNSDDDVVVINIESNKSNKTSRNNRSKRIDECFGFSQLDPKKPQIGKSKVDSSDINTNIHLAEDLNRLDEDPFPKIYSKKQLKEKKTTTNMVNTQSGSSNLGSQSGVMSTTNWNLNEESVKVNSNKKNTRGQSDSKGKQLIYNKWEDDYMNPVSLQNFSTDNYNRTRGRRRSATGGKQLEEPIDLDGDETEIRGDHSEEENPTTAARQPQQVEMVECPLCGKLFSVGKIEHHAGACDGPAQDDEPQMMEERVPVNGELVTCPICDKQIPKPSLERHVEECWNVAAEKEAQQKVEAPVQTRRGKLRTATPDPPLEPVSPRRPLHRNRENIDRYRQDDSVSGSCESTDGSSWDDSDSSSSDDNVTLRSLARTGNSALIAGPWNQTKQKENQSGVTPDWLKNGSSSPIKSFVPISQQEDADYYSKQFSYNQKRVEQRQAKRKRANGKPKKRRKKRRKVRRKTKT